MKCFEVAGNDYQMGFTVGVAFKDYLQGIAARRGELFEDPDVEAFVNGLIARIEDETPDCMEELRGRAAGAGIPLGLMVVLSSPEISSLKGGCTTAVLKKPDGAWLFSHNEDEVGFTKDNVALVKYVYDDAWIVGYTMAETLVGRSFAYNSYGMVFSCNFLLGARRDVSYPSRYIAIRSILKARSLDEALDMMKAAHTASSFSLNVLDTRTGMAANVEKTVDDTYITPITDRFSHANHFIAAADELSFGVNTYHRGAKAQELLGQVNAGAAGVDDIIGVLSYEGEDYWHSILKRPETFKALWEKSHKSVTVANFAFDGENHRVLIHDYLDDDVLQMPYDRFVSNTRIEAVPPVEGR